MSDFKYKAKDGPERMVEGIVEADSEVTAIEKISQLGLVPISVRAYNADKDAQRNDPKVSQSKKVLKLILFSRHLASLIKSGVPILRGLTIMSDQEDDKEYKEALISLMRQIQDGSTLSQACESLPEFFPRMYTAVLRAGETSGTLQESFEQMAIYYKKQRETKSKIGRALAYPAVLSTAGIGTIIFVVSFVVPRLAPLFESMGQKLPLPTRVVMAVSGFIQTFWWVLALFFAGIFFLLPTLINKYLGTSFYDLVKLKIPFLGKLIFKSEFARFCRTLKMSLVSGIPFVEALETAIPAVNNRVIAKSLRAAHLQIQKGESLGASLKNESYFPSFVINLLSIGEESGKMDESLSEIASLYEEQIDEGLQLLTTLLEPLMILIIGSIVGFVIIAMMLPIFEMNTAVS